MTATDKTRRCAYCGRTKHRDGFPSSGMAKCWECAWNDHIATAHRSVGRKIRRAARRRARRLKRTEVEAAMFRTERQQVLGTQIDEPEAE